MTDVAEAPAAAMRHASEHASTNPDPPASQAHLTRAPEPAPASLPSEPVHPSRNSEDSSLSHSSRPATLLLSTSDVDGANNPGGHNDDSTPPSSAISSQLDSQGRESPSLLGKSQDAVKSDQREGSYEQWCNSTSESPRPGSISGTKRTASGQVKRASGNGGGDVARASDVGHSRTSSVVSNGTNGNILELSQQLRTKLKYAMVKVQNGWQTRSLDEVESLASQSPRSTLSGFHRLDNQHMVSPRAVMSRRYQRESSESDSSDSTVALENCGLVNMMGSPQVTSRRALAPPVDITPGSRRRPTPNATYHSVGGPQVQVRQLHSSRPPTSQRTPSQNAAMEADAVETLLFMASPNNSGYNPPSHASQDSSLRSTQLFASQTSPLRTQFSQASMTSPKKVAFSSQRSIDPSVDKAALIDRMLDEVSDDSDDELQQAFRLAGKTETTATVST